MPDLQPRKFLFQLFDCLFLSLFSASYTDTYDLKKFILETASRAGLEDLLASA